MTQPSISSNILINSQEEAVEEEAQADSVLLNKAFEIYWFESQIDPERKLYLITWSPDPKQLPDADFQLQHNMNVNLLQMYLLSCYVGLFCVESTQLGNPHYHGWYQIDEKCELQRIRVIKTMQRFGRVDIESKVRNYRIHSYTKAANSLYYYKKDLLDSMLDIEYNPITEDTHCDIDFKALDIISFLDTRGPKFQRKAPIDVLSDQVSYMQFYSDTIDYISK